MMSNFNCLIAAIGGIVCFLSMGYSAAAQQNVCDMKVLKRPGCEVGDFDGSKGPPGPSMMGHLKLAKDARRRALEVFRTAASRSLEGKDYEGAIRILKQSVAAEPDNIQNRAALCDAHVQYGDDLRAKRDIKGATREYQLALSISNDCQKAKQRLKELRDGH
jgi:tetratricopeptide (TPR) repeat protein